MNKPARSFLIPILLLIALLLLAAPLLAQEVPPPDPNAIYAAFLSHNWTTLSMLLIPVLFVFVHLPVLNDRVASLPWWAKPLVPFALGALSAAFHAWNLRAPVGVALITFVLTALAGLSAAYSPYWPRVVDSRDKALCRSKGGGSNASTVTGAILIVAVFGSANTGCAWIRGACASAMPVISQSQTYEADAQQYLNRVSTLFAGDPEVAAILGECRVALDAVRVALVGMASTCAAVDSTSLFSTFTAIATTKLEPALHAKLGGKPALQPPMIVLKARGLL